MTDHLDYAVRFLTDVCGETYRNMGYEDFPFNLMAIDLFKYLAARGFVITRPDVDPNYDDPILTL